MNWHRTSGAVARHDAARLSYAEAAELLQFIPAHSRETWVRVGGALHHEFGDKGLTLWDAWGQSADNYCPKASREVWRSFKGSVKMPATAGTLVYLATQYGWRRKAHGESMALPAPRPVFTLPAPRNLSGYALSSWLAAGESDAFVSNHPYCQRKGVMSSGGARRGRISGGLLGSNADCVLVPARNLLTGKVQGVQAINAEGVKQSFGAFADSALVLGNTLNVGGRWYVAEGWATAYAVVFHHKLGHAACAVSFGKSRMRRVAALVAQAFAPAELCLLWEEDT